LNVGEIGNRRGSGNTAVRQEVEVDICPDQAGYILSVGPLSIWLDGATAEDVVEMLERAIATRAMTGQPATLTRGVRGSN
jgi:hypothetical protein